MNENNNETVNKIIEVLDTKIDQLWQEMVEILNLNLLKMEL
jgi:hypothetical protein